MSHVRGQAPRCRHRSPRLISGSPRKQHPPRMGVLLCQDLSRVEVMMRPSIPTSPYAEGVLRPENWTRPAGESPVRVIAGEPGSRPRSVAERRRAERGVKSLFGGSKRAGRSATRRESCSLVTFTTGEPSRSCHGEGRTSDRLAFRRCPWSGPLGVRGAARTHGMVRDRRGPSCQPRQQRPSYKPVVKSTEASGSPTGS